MRVWPGTAYPLGATYDGSGTNFALFSEVAERVELCLFDADGTETRVDAARGRRLRLARVPARRRAGAALRLPGARPVRPGARAAVQPEQAAARPVREGHRRHLRLGPVAVQLHTSATRTAATTRTRRRTCRSRVVINPFFDWGVDRPPRRQYNETVIYEAHVKGLTETHPGIPEEHPRHLRGDRAPGDHRAPEVARRHGDRADAGAPLRQRLDADRQGPVATTGATTRSASSRRTASTSSTNTAGGQVQEFKAMVRALHEAGIEVILDVVYNHTAEGNHLGPDAVACAGIDNAAYYRLVDDDPRYYMDYTGTGNTLNVRHPHALQLIMDSLRYWVTEMHVDGFRFDLAATLAREFYDVDRLSSFFELVQQDPTVSQVKLIAEPWDVGPGGYQVGNFPPQWTEWNGKYRDTVRDFWRGEAATPRRVRVADHRLGRPVRALGPPPGGVDQLRHGARRLHPARPGLVQREAQRGQRRGQQRRREPQPVVELRRRGADRRPGRPRAAGAAVAQLHRHAAAVPGRADDLPRRRARPHAGRQQQRLLPGQRDHLGRLGAPADDDLLAFTRRWSPGCASGTRCSGAGGSSRAGRCAAAAPRDCRTSRGCARTARRCPRRTGAPASASRWASSSTATASPTATCAGERVVDDSFIMFFSSHYEPIDFTLPRRLRRGVARRRRHDPRPGRGGEAAAER